MTTLVLGNKGFIGSNVEGDCHLDKVDLRCMSSLLNGFDEAKFDPNPTLLINCAGKHGSMLEMGRNHLEYVTTNFLIDRNCLSLCAERNIGSAILVSSITCFPDTRMDVFSEEDIHFGEVSSGIYGYAMSKRNTIGLCKCAYMDYGVNSIPVVLGNCYGEHGEFSSNGTIIHKLIHDIDLAIRQDREICLTGDGYDVRTFLFAEDLKNVFAKIATMDMRGEPVVVASPEQTTIRDLTSMIASIMGFKKPIRFTGGNTLGHKRKVAVSKKIDITDFNLTPLEDGLHRTVEFYKRNRNGLPIN